MLHKGLHRGDGTHPELLERQGRYYRLSSLLLMHRASQLEELQDYVYQFRDRMPLLLKIQNVQKLRRRVYVKPFFFFEIPSISPSSRLNSRRYPFATKVTWCFVGMSLKLW